MKNILVFLGCFLVFIQGINGQETTYTTSPSEGNFTSCFFPNLDCTDFPSNPFVYEGGTIRIEVINILGNQISMEVSKCDGGSFFNDGHINLRSEICGGLQDNFNSSEITYSAGDLSIPIIAQLSSTFTEGQIEVRCAMASGSGPSTGYLYSLPVTIFAETTEIPEDELAVNPVLLSFGSSADSDNIQISSNINWNVVDNQSWIAVSPSSGSNDGNITIAVSENTSCLTRSGSITVSGNGLSETISISQQGTPCTYNLEVTDGINISPNPLVQGEDRNIDATITNTGNNDFCGEIYLFWHDENGLFITDIDIATNLEAENNVVLSSIGTVQSSPGNYQVHVKYQECNSSGFVTLDVRNINVINGSDNCAQTDSLALVSLYNATNGANWTNPWILTNPMNTWEGVDLNTDGCVIELNLFNRNLNGTLPNINLPNVTELRIINDQGAPANLIGAVPSFSNMPLLEQINLGGNGFTSLPDVAEFNLPDLWYFSVAQNQILGSLPDYNLPALEQIYFSENNLTGIIPNFSGMPVLERLHFHSNALGGTLPDFTNLPFLVQLSAFSTDIDEITYPTQFINTGNSFETMELGFNQLTFDDLLPMINDLNYQVGSNPDYIPQDSFFLSAPYNVEIGDDLTIDLGIDAGLTDNEYVWRKSDGTIVSTTNSNTYTFQNIQAADADTYIVEVTNPGAVNLTLYSYPIEINVQPVASIFTAEPNTEVETIVRDSLFKADCYDISNITQQGNPLSLGTFAGAMPFAGFDTGIVIATGFVSQHPGVSSSLLSTNTESPVLGDEDLESLTTVGIDDIHILEFDITPTVGIISLEYFMASEEYCDFAPPNNSSYNDVFGIFISGPGIEGTQNIAIIPGEDTPVGITSINPVTNPDLFNSNGSDCGGNGPGTNIFAFDGYTDVMRAESIVIPCETYHIKIGIADVGDSVFDSAIFLKGNSFEAGNQVSRAIENTISENNFTYENSSDNPTLVFSRNEEDTTEPVSIEYVLSGTATEGVDYTGLPSSPIIIPAGELQIQIPLTIIADAIAESDETIEILPYNTCTCDISTITILSTCQENDSLALVQLYNATAGADWTNPWILTNPINTWEGVVTTGEGCVTQVNLFSRNLNGTLPDLDLPNLIALRIIDSPNLTGTLPDFTNMNEVVDLNLGGNGFTQLPDAANLNLPNLQYWNLAGNNLTGTMPDYNLPVLEEIFYSDNDLTGTVLNFSGMPSLRKLHFHSNEIEGTLPNFTMLPNLNNVSIFATELDSITPPAEFLADENIFELMQLGFNKFTFDDLLPMINDLPYSGGNAAEYIPQDSFFLSIPYNVDVGDDLTINLGIDAGLADNQYIWRKSDGTIITTTNSNTYTFENIQTTDADTYIVEATNPNAADLALYSYPIEINVGPSCRMIDSLALVALYNATDGQNWSTPWNLNNSIDSWYGITLNTSGCVICIDLDGGDGSCTDDDTGNNLVGTIPDEIGDITSLQNLFLSNNQLQSPIPATIGNLTQLTFLELNNNLFAQELPEEFGNLTSLEYLELDDNAFTGIIPDSYGNLSNLIGIYLFNNELTGPIPNTFTNLTNLQYLTVFGNELSGTLPDLSNLPLIECQISDNDFTGVPDLTAITSWGTDNFNGLKVENNALTFEDILTNISIDDSYNYDYAPQDTIFTPTQITQDAGTPLTIDLLIDENIASNEYNWYKDGELYTTIIGNNDLTFTNLQVSDSGVYTVEITNPSAPDLILISHPITINVNPVCAVNLGNDTLACDQILLDAGDDFIDFTWSDGSENQTLPVTISGTYSVTATNADGCTNMDEIEVTIVTSPQASISGDTEFCTGQSITLDGGTFTTYLWSTTEDTPSISVNTPGNYALTVTDANNCIGTTDIDITENPLPPVTISGEDTYCFGESTTLSATAGYPTYSWSTTENTEMITVNSPDTYSVTVTDSNNCQNTNSLSVTENPTPIVNILGATTACAGESISLSIDGTFTTYLWSTGETNPTIMVTSSDDYSVMVTDENDCTASDATNVIFTPLPQPVITGNTSLCDGTTTELSLTETYTTYLWSTGESTPTIIVPAGIYAVTVTDENTCVGESSNIEISNTDNPTVEITGDTDFCTGQSIIISATSGYPEYLWSTGATTESITITTGGNYQVTITDSEGCQVNTDTNITENSLPSVSILGNTEVCTNETTTFSSDATFSEYLWSTGATTSDIQVNAGGIYTLAVTDENNCSSETVQIELTNLSEIIPSANTGQDIELCEEGNVQLSANLPAGTTGVWSSLNDIEIEDPTDPNSFAFDLLAGIYQLTWTLATDNCPALSQDNLNINIAIAPNAIDDAIMGAFGEELTGNVLDNDNFVGGVTLEIPTPPLPVGLTLIEDNDIWTGEWTFVASSAGETGAEINYQICSTECPDLCSTALLSVVTPLTEGFVPEGFTPNNDGVNDFFIIPELEDPTAFPDNKIIIFNRWGDIVFEQKDYRNTWRGEYQKTDANLPAGSYYYIAWLDVGEGEIREGSVVIIR